ncbi:MAG: hypothetical protein ACYDHF_02970 [Candidatus Cryosericum sp.]
MIPFSAIFSTDFFFSLGYVILSVAGLVYAASFRRSQGGKTSLFLLLTAACVTTYYMLQWLLSSFVSYFVSNYAYAHTDFTMPGWVNPTLVVLFTALNYGFVIGLGLTAWSAVRKSRVDRAMVAEAASEACVADSETSESSEAAEPAVNEAVAAEPPVSGPEA